LEEAKAYLTKALEYQADLPQAHQNLGVILYREEKFAEAIAHWRDALRIDPDYSNAHVSLGIHFLGHGQFTEANRHFSAAVELRPDDAIVRYHLGATWDKLGQPAQAAMHFHRALQLAPDAVPALLGLAAIHSTSADPTLRDPSAGIRLAERACKLTRYEYPQALLTLSDAYREAGRLPEAISVAQRALDIVRKAGDQRSAKDIQQRINACRDRMRLPSSAARP
jgi:tetratricopeptide (TPR) repeat protein